MNFYNLRGIVSSNRNLVMNSIGAILIKGAGIIVGIITVPLYMRYFPDNTTLGVWYTILNVLSWILNFDLGIGNGLRNHLTTAIVEKDIRKARELISSSYIILGILVLVIGSVFFLLSSIANWNHFFNVLESQISPHTLLLAVNVTMLGILCSFVTRIIGNILYAQQKAALNNILGLTTNVLMAAYLFFFKSNGNVEENLLTLSVYNALATNLPFIIATLFIFRQPFLRECLPSYKYFNTNSAKAVLGLGSLFLIIQLLYMALCGTNEWFISSFFHPSFCVDYNIYNKVFSLVSSFFIIALVPMWSAFTKAFAEKNYRWLKKAQRALYLIALVTVLFQLLLVPFMQPIIDFWLKDKSIIVETDIVVGFVIYSSFLIINNVESTIVCGLGKLNIQVIGYIFAVVFKFLGIYLLSSYTNNWILVVILTSLGFLPYLIIQPFFIKREIEKFK